MSTDIQSLLLGAPRRVLLPHPFNESGVMCSPYLAPRDHPEDTDWEFGYRNCHGEAFIHPATGTDLAQMVTVLLPLIEKLRVDKPGRLGLPPKPCARGV